MSIRRFCKSIEKENPEPGPIPKHFRLDEDNDSSASSLEDESSSGHHLAQEKNSSTASGSSSTDSSRRSKRNKFCTEWIKGRQHWLKYVPGQGMLCTLCQKHNKSSHPFPVTDSDYRALQHMNVVLLTNIYEKWKLKRRPQFRVPSTPRYLQSL